MLHRKNTLEKLKQYQQQNKVNLYVENDMLDLAIQLAEEQQEYILKLSNSVRNARKAAKGNLVGLVRAQNELLREQLWRERAEMTLSKLKERFFKINENLGKFGLKMRVPTLTETHEEIELKKNFINELLK